MFVAMVTAPGLPASATISDSRLCCFAFNTLWAATAALEQARQGLRHLNVGRTYQHRQLHVMKSLDLVHDHVELFALGAEDEIFPQSSLTMGRLVGMTMTSRS